MTMVVQLKILPNNTYLSVIPALVAGMTER